MWSATIAATTGVLYVVVGLIGVIARPPSPNHSAPVSHKGE